MRIDGEIGERIGRRPLFDEPAQRLLGIGGLQQRAIGLLAHPGEQDLETRLQPDREPVPRDIVARRRIHERAAAGRQHQRAAIEQARDHLALALAEVRLAEPLEDLGNGQLGARLDLRVRIGERQAQLRRQPFADRGFSSPHHAHENNRAPAEGGRRPPGVDRLTLAHDPPTSSREPVLAASRSRRPIQEAGGECEPRRGFCEGAANVLRAAPVLASMLVARHEVRGGRRAGPPQDQGAATP